MPTYEYKCNACGHRFEQFQAMSAAPIKVCPHCGKKKVERLIGIGAAVLFKGSGFYQTDYRSDSYKKAAEADSKSPAPAADAKAGETTAGEAKASESKADAKPADAKPAESKVNAPSAPVKIDPPRTPASKSATAKSSKSSPKRTKR